MPLWAASPAPDDSSIRSNPTFKALSADLAHDIREFDGLKLSPQERARLAAGWKEYVSGDFTKDAICTNPFIAPFCVPSLLSSPPALPVPLMTPDPALTTVLVPTIAGIPHSIRDIDQYVQQRLGPELASLLKSNQVNVVVYGGTDSSLAKETAGRTLVKIPSLYDSWGIEKYLDVTPGEAKPTVVLRVPPIQQYVQHYGMLTKLAGGELKSATLNEADRQADHAQLQSAVNALYASIGQKPDYVVLGYADALAKDLSRPSSPWQVQGAPVEAKGADGLTGTLYTLQDKTDPTIQRKLLSISAQQTMWGEESATLTSAVLDHQPRGIVFLGSAGAPSPRANIYDVTVPGAFVNGSGKIPIANDANQFRLATPSGQVKYGVTHGSTISPAEQTIDFTTRLASQGIDTLDAEENLIAATVANYDKTNHAGVTFAAANVVTDKPRSKLYDWTESASLSNVDATRKAESRVVAAQTILGALDQRANWEKNADNLRKQAILKALPGLDPARIFLDNGQGKTDADPKHKLSYYIFTENPRDPASHTTLIPMATSRFDENNYQTDEWWDAHKTELETARRNGTPAPRQDRSEVRNYLRENGLSTNPDVISIDPRSGQSTRTPLKDFLLNEYLSRYTTKDGYVALYRGAVKPGELDTWKSGQFPRGVRYWTPDANYAWRYGRKNTDFLKLLVQDQAPVFKYRIPKQEFVDLVRRGHLVVGTEMTKRVHDTLTYSHRFQDQLTGYDYLGDGRFGLEQEVRADGAARPGFTRYFAGAIGVDDLADARIQQIQAGTDRLVLEYPDETASLRKTEQTRIAEVEAERDVLNLVRSGAPSGEIEAAVAKLGAGRPEIANIDGTDLRSFARSFHVPSPKPIPAREPAAASCLIQGVRDISAETHP